MRTHTIAVEQRPMRQRCAARQVAVRRSAGALARADPDVLLFFGGKASELLCPLTQARIANNIDRTATSLHSGGEGRGQGMYSLKSAHVIFFSLKCFVAVFFRSMILKSTRS